MKSYTYPTSHRRLEIAAIIAQSLIALRMAQLVGRALTAHPADSNTATLSVTVVFGLVCGYLVSDFSSGMTHWLADTYGSPQTPVLGANFVRTFREHHTDPLAITRHDFIETNGSSCIFSFPVVAAVALWVTTPFGFALTFAFGISICLTSQIHKWAHSAERSRTVRLAQALRLILSTPHHDRHHHAPFDRQYCITTGWLNPVLAQLRYFQILEWTIGKVLRLSPRAYMTVESDEQQAA